MASYSTRLRAALNWARNHDLIVRTPYIEVEVEEVAASRGIRLEEFERILLAVPKVRPHDAACWDRFLRGLHATNLRVSELARLSWDQADPIYLDTTGVVPLIRLAPRSHKSRKPRIQAVTRQFWNVAAETPKPNRIGTVLPISNGCGGDMSVSRIIHVIGEIGERAGVVTNAGKGKTATSHDIGRRAFVPQVDSQLTATELHRLMGHADFNTTLRFYDTRAAEQIGVKLGDWPDWRAVSDAVSDAHQLATAKAAKTQESKGQVVKELT